MLETHSPGLIDAIMAAVDEGFSDQLAFTKKLVAIASLRAEEQPAQDMISAELASLGFDVDCFPVNEWEFGRDPAFSPITANASKADNIVGLRKSVSHSGRSLAINSHVDVVPSGAIERWKSDPFLPVESDGWLYGRGAGDMKAGLAASLFAVRALDRAGIVLNGELQIHSVVEEEITGNGAAMVLARGYCADALLSPEPTDEKLVRANSGVIKFEITLAGVPAHPREASSGVSAIEAAITLITHLKTLESRWNDEKSRHAYFEDIENPASLVIGTIDGGEWIASLPSRCRFDGRIGFYPGESATKRAEEFEQFIATVMKDDPLLTQLGEAKICWTGVMQPGYAVEPDLPAEQLLQECHRHVQSGVCKTENLSSFVMPCYLDAAIFAVHADMPVYVYGPIAENIHAFDERVSIESIRRVTKVMALFVASWCGVKFQSKGTAS